jgi:hypothetical protein
MVTSLIAWKHLKYLDVSTYKGLIWALPISGTIWTTSGIYAGVGEDS